MNITLSGREFVVAFDYHPDLVSAVKTLPQRRFDRNTKAWTVPLACAAELLALVERLDGVEVDFAPDAREAAVKAGEARAEALVASRAADWDGELPVPAGLEYLGYQKAGIAYAMERRGCLLGDEMGLGKTIQAIGAVNADPKACSVLIICPASLKINWSREFRKWDTKSLTVAIANGKFPTANVVIINYDIVRKHRKAIDARSWDVLICDECHYLKNPKAARTKVVMGAWDRDPAKRIEPIAAGRRLFLTGTPILNRPIELWPLLKALDPEGLGRNWRGFVTRYCAGHQSGYGWDVSGASNLNELQDRMRAAFMVRRLKMDVLTELPPKRRSVVELSADGVTGIVKAERDAYERAQARMQDARVAVELAKAEGDAQYAAAVSRLQELSGVIMTEMSALRHDVALAKVPAVTEYVADLLDSEKIVLFAHHHDVVDAIAAAFKGQCVCLTGRDSQEARQAAVDRFQRDPECRLFIGGIHAAGVGITLTAASHVVFAELDWVPGNISQAEDRCHRMGQQNHVFVEHLVLDGSLDVRMANTLVAKQAVLDAALDDADRADLGQIHVDPQAPATADVPRSALQELADKMTPEHIARAHQALQMLAQVCDYAQRHDGVGFNACDARIGHELAIRPSLSPRQAALGAKLCQKYRKQLGFDTMDGLHG